MAKKFLVRMVSKFRRMKFKVVVHLNQPNYLKYLFD